MCHQIWESSANILCIFIRVKKEKEKRKKSNCEGHWCVSKGSGEVFDYGSPE